MSGYDIKDFANASTQLGQNSVPALFDAVSSSKCNTQSLGIGVF